jgi:hypothetical protein
MQKKKIQCDESQILIFIHTVGPEITDTLDEDEQK